MQPTHLPNSSSNISSNFWRYTIPAIAAMMVSGLYQIVDGIFVGHYVGYQGLAAINLAWPITYVLSGLGLMVGIGAGTLISIARGENKPLNAQYALNTAMVLVGIIGVLSFIVLTKFGESLLTIQGATGEIKALGLQYVSAFGWASLITVLSAAIPMLIRNDDSPKIATALLISGALVNILFDYLFIGVFGWQLQGAALATILGQSITVIGGIVYFLSARSELNLIVSIKDFQYKRGLKVITLGTSALMMSLYTSFVVALHNYQLMQYGTELTVGAFAIIGYMMTLYYLVAEGIAEGLQPPVSYYFGAKQPRHIKKTVILAVKTTVLVGIGWYLLLNSFPSTIIGLFNNDPALKLEAMYGIRLHLFAMFLDGFIILTSMYFVSVDKGGKALLITISNMLIQIPFLYFLPKWLGVEGVWLSMPLSTVILSLIVAPFLIMDIRQRCRTTDSEMAEPSVQTA